MGAKGPKPRPPSVDDGFWSRVCLGYGGPCWVWIGATVGGYGIVRRAGTSKYAHVLSYEWARGPVPPGRELDHTCRNRACVNPGHLEPVTHKVNVLRGDGACARHARKTNCKRGHPLVAGNLLSHPASRGHRNCRICNREYQRGWSRRKRTNTKESARGN